MMCTYHCNECCTRHGVCCTRHGVRVLQADVLHKQDDNSSNTYQGSRGRCGHATGGSSGWVLYKGKPDGLISTSTTTPSLGNTCTQTSHMQSGSRNKASYRRRRCPTGTAAHPGVQALASSNASCAAAATQPNKSFENKPNQNQQRKHPGTPMLRLPSSKTGSPGKQPHPPNVSGSRWWQTPVAVKARLLESHLPYGQNGTPGPVVLCTGWQPTQRMPQAAHAQKPYPAKKTLEPSSLKSEKSGRISRTKNPTGRRSHTHKLYTQYTRYVHIHTQNSLRWGQGVSSSGIVVHTCTLACRDNKSRHNSARLFSLALPVMLSTNSAAWEDSRLASAACHMHHQLPSKAPSTRLVLATNPQVPMAARRARTARVRTHPALHDLLLAVSPAPLNPASLCWEAPPAHKSHLCLAAQPLTC